MNIQSIFYSYPHYSTIQSRAFFFKEKTHSTSEVTWLGWGPRARHQLLGLGGGEKGWFFFRKPLDALVFYWIWVKFLRFFWVECCFVCWAALTPFSFVFPEKNRAVLVPRALLLSWDPEHHSTTSSVNPWSRFLLVDYAWRGPTQWFHQVLDGTRWRLEIHVTISDNNDGMMTCNREYRDVLCA